MANGSSQKTVVIAIGGNALVPDNDSLKISAQMQNASVIATHVVDMIEDGWRVVLTHGNGPHVGAILRKNKLAADVLPSNPVDVVGGETQGAIGYLLQQTIGNELKRRNINMPIASVVTQVEVNKNDPAFKNPDKPIGQFMEEDEAQRMATAEGWTVREDSGRGWRRVIASPKPVDIVEADFINTLIREGCLVIACGGGGIPVTRDNDGQLHGADAVIDKDRASSLLAARLQADMLLIPTGVEKVAINFGKPDQKWLDTLSIKDAERYMDEGQFGAGSMGPKVEAILDYLESQPKGCGIITDLDAVCRALRGETGTRIQKD